MPLNPPEGYHTLTAQTVVDDAAETIQFVKDVFDAELLSVFEDDGLIRHAEVQIGGSRLMLATANEDFGEFPVMLTVYVDDVDAVFAKAIDNGAAPLREPEDQFYGDRTGGVVDGQGNQWWISTHIEDVTEEEMRRRMSQMGS